MKKERLEDLQFCHSNRCVQSPRMSIFHEMHLIIGSLSLPSFVLRVSLPDPARNKDLACDGSFV